MLTLAIVYPSTCSHTQHTFDRGSYSAFGDISLNNEIDFQTLTIINIKKELFSEVSMSFGNFVETM